MVKFTPNISIYRYRESGITNWMVCKKFSFHFAMAKLTRLDFCKGHGHLYVQRALKMVFVPILLKSP